MRFLILALVLLSMAGLSYGVDISSCQTISSSGIYYLTADVFNYDGTCFMINVSDVVLDCQGHLIEGNYTGYGIHLNAVYTTLNNISINNCIVRMYWEGIYYEGELGGITNSNVDNVNSSMNAMSGLYLHNSNNCVINNLTADLNYYGIYIRYSDNNIINRSNITLNKHSGIYIRDSKNNLLYDLISKENKYYDLKIYAWNSSYCSNKLVNVLGTNNILIGYYNYSVNLENQTFSELILCNASYSNLTNIRINSSNTLKNNGMYVYYTDRSKFEDINSSHNYDGLSLRYSNSNIITNITADYNTQHGLYLSYSNSNIITNITVNFNSRGLYLDESNSNTINNSKINNNSQYGIYVYESGNSGVNKIYNNFFNNTNNVYFGGSIYANNWNNSLSPGPNIYGGQYIGGNFYANPNGNGYSETCTDSDEDGICDSPYVLAENNPDYLPLSRKIFPLNPEIYVGTQRVWNYTGYFKGTVNNIDIKNAILNYISTCTPNSNNRCDVPITTHSDNRARIKISDLNITYEYINPKYRAYISNTGLKDMNIKKIDIISKNGDVCELYNGLEQLIKGALKIYKGNCTFGCSLFDYALFTSTCGLKDKREEYRVCKFEEY